MAKQPEVERIRMQRNPKEVIMIDKDELDTTTEIMHVSNVKPDYYCPDSDVVIYDIDIFKDYNNSAFMKIRMANLGDKDILGVYFRVIGYSKSGEKQGENEYSLIDLTFKPCEVMTTGYIKLFDDDIEKLRVDVTKIVDKEYNAREVKIGRLVPIPKLVRVEDKLDNIVVEILGLKEDELYFVDPLTDGFAICTCGHLRKAKCPVCGRTDGLDNDMNEVNARIKETISSIVGDVEKIDSLDIAIDTRNRLDRHLMTIATLTGFDEVKKYGREGLAKLDKRIKKLERKARRGKKPLIIILLLIAVLIVTGYFVYQNGGIEWIQSLLNK